MRKYANTAPAPAITAFSLFFIFGKFKIFNDYYADDGYCEYRTGKQVFCEA